MYGLKTAMRKDKRGEKHHGMPSGFEKSHSGIGYPMDKKSDYEMGKAMMEYGKMLMGMGNTKPKEDMNMGGDVGANDYEKYGESAGMQYKEAEYGGAKKSGMSGKMKMMAMKKKYKGSY